ncbi:clindamycin resistance transfer factor BtgB [Bacteroides fragilis]|nr:clindamycin resistance transfer factor BtgB [Bacteroides fragilis]
MHIDFASPSGGTYNNAGSSRQLASYMEHEDLERMEKGIYTDGFFNLIEDNIYKSKVIKDIDTNTGQLLKTDAKFYAIHVSPSEKELQAMGNTEQEQAESMKRYIREVFIPEYAKNFNKGLSEADIKFYGKIHFDRSRSDNELNMHCHLIVSRKDQANKKKLSPLTNHKNTKNGIIKGGFDRVNLFQQAEQGFDKLFGYDRQQSESFDYHNTMKNGSISEQLELQNQNFTGEKKKEVFQSSEKENNISCNLDNKEGNRHSNNQQHNSRGDSLLSIFSVGEDNNNDSIPVEELQAQKRKKKKKRGIRR